MTLRIGLFAEAFGFGPVSKVCTLGKACQQTLDCELVAFGDSITNEYFKREGIENVIEVSLADASDPACVRALCKNFDLAIIGIQPEWAGEIQLYRPVVYLDSLGFMWNKKYFSHYPKLRNVEAFLAQDLFGAAQHLADKGIKNIYRVGPLIALPAETEAESCSPVIHMGGLANIFNKEDGILYANFITSLLEGKVSEAICSNSIAEAIGNEKHGISFHSLTNQRTRAIFAGAEVLYTSPGLTGLLEAAAVNANVVPLPPQNYSQALIVDRIATMQDSDSVWSFLKDHYPIDDQLDEEEGVARVQAFNRNYSKNLAFHGAYLRAVKKFGSQKLPAELAIENGVSTAVSIVESLITKLVKL